MEETDDSDESSSDSEQIGQGHGSEDDSLHTALSASTLLQDLDPKVTAMATQVKMPGQSLKSDKPKIEEVQNQLNGSNTVT